MPDPGKSDRAARRAGITPGITPSGSKASVETLRARVQTRESAMRLTQTEADTARAAWIRAVNMLNDAMKAKA